MNTNRKQEQIPRPVMRTPRIDDQDAHVVVDAVVLHERRKISPASAPRLLMNVQPSADEGLGAICLGEHG
jgi:hypothetical protein